MLGVLFKLVLLVQCYYYFFLVCVIWFCFYRKTEIQFFWQSVKSSAVQIFYCLVLGKSSQNVEDSSSRGLDSKTSGASIKDVLKEQRFLEKKVALSRKRRRESRYSFLSLQEKLLIFPPY